MNRKTKHEIFSVNRINRCLLLSRVGKDIVGSPLSRHLLLEKGLRSEGQSGGRGAGGTFENFCVLSFEE